MRNLIVIALVSAAVMGAQSASAAPSWKTLVIHGNNCTSISGRTPLYGQYGPYTDSMTAGLYINCPILPPTVSGARVTVATLQVNGYNRSGTGQLRCTLLGTQYDGRRPVSARAEMIYVGGRYGQAEVSLNQAEGGPSDLLSIMCYLPPRTALGRSHLTSIVLTLRYE
jgi:hypothetical protein